MRIDLEKTLALAESLYKQVMAVESKLPNAIRTIIGLPEVEEEPVTTANLEAGQGPSGDSGSFSASKKRKTESPRPGSDLETMSSATAGNDLAVPNGNLVSNISTSPDVEALENQYEIGVSQFM